MKTMLLPLAAALLGAMPFARAGISIDVFYDSLEPYGDWIDVADYGYCWQPRDVPPDWRPYTIGEWVYTDAGWTWVSAEPFGWAVYHYGRWTRLAQTGWVWRPDATWGPAWVSWRYSDRYIGWAPLPPESRLTVGADIGAWADVRFDIGPMAYCFVETRQFSAPRLVDVLAAPRENIAIIRETRNVTNVRVVNNVVINNGPDYGAVARAADRPIRKLRLEREGAVPGANLNARVEGDAVKIPAPRVTAKAMTKPRRVAQRLDSAEIDRGWKNAGTTAEMQPLREKMKSEANEPGNAPAPTVTVKTKPPLPPVAESPPPKSSMKPRRGSRPPTPEPPRHLKPMPDRTERVRPKPPISQPPEPHVTTPRIDEQPRRAPHPPQPRAQQQRPAPPEKSKLPTKGHDQPKERKDDKKER